MAKPRSRQEFKEYCLRALGAPVIEINVDDSQVEDRIDQALQYFADWNSNGAQRTYWKYQVTAQDIANKYINTDTLSPGGSDILTVSRVFQIGFNLQVNNIFNVRYQMALNDFYGLRTGQMNLNYFVSTMQYIEMLQQLLDPEKQVRFNKYNNKIQIDMNWEDFAPDQYLLIEGYTIVDPEEYSEAWNDPMLKKYATALIKQQWGANLSKFEGIPMPGNITFNGQRLYEEATTAIQNIEEEVLLKYQEPPDFITG
jgi:hypothetical protein